MATNLHTIETTPETVEWGHYDPDAAAIDTVAPGETVEIETVTPPQDGDHVEFLTDAGIAREDVLDDELTIAEEVAHDGPGPHVVTGPIHVEGATPGDVLEVTVKDIEFRAPYGVNLILPTGGELAEQFPREETYAVPFDREAGVAQFAPDVEVPLDPFFGIMATGPEPTQGPTNTAPPDYFGGNLDLKQLGVGSTLYLPVHAEGAQFWVGDGHGVQGNGEVCLTAAETSLTGTFEFDVHEPAGHLDWPVAETDEHYVVTGIDPSLDAAMNQAVRACVSLLESQQGLAPADAYRLASLAVDFNVTQVVNGNKGIHGLIPKALFDGESLDPAAFGA